MTPVASLTRAQLVTMNLRRCTAPWRRRHFSTTSINSSQRQKTKTFTKHIDEDGEVYYTLATKKEGKHLPQGPDVNNLFEMPDLVLDLDAETRQNRVREFTGDDEKLLGSKWGRSPKRQAVHARMNQMVSAVGQLRSKTDKMLSDRTDPNHVTDYDITSTALRSIVQGKEGRHDLYPRRPATGSEDSAEAQVEELEQPDQPKRPVVTAFSHMHPRGRSDLPAAAASVTQDLVQSNSNESAMGYIIAQGDPRGRPDYMRNLRDLSGIPSYTVKNDEQIIRWMMLHRHNTNYTWMKQETPPPTQADIVKKLRSFEHPHVMRRNLFYIRRTIFLSINAGTDLRVSKGDRSNNAENVPLAIRDNVAGILDKFTGNFAPHLTTLTFVNNLAARLPKRDADMSAALFSLRLRALAGMGLTDLTAAQLEQGVSAEMWDSSVDVLNDVAGAMSSWKLGLQQNPVLQTQHGRRLLFRILTGFGEAGVALPTSYRSLILHPSSDKGDIPHSNRLRAFMRYIELLGYLGAARTLWAEWRTVSELLAQAGEEDPTTKSDASASISECLHRALLDAMEVSDLSSDSHHEEPSSKECAAMDYSSISSKTAETGEMTSGGSETSEMSLAKREELKNMMDLPLKDWLERVKTWS